MLLEIKQILRIENERETSEKRREEGVTNSNTKAYHVEIFFEDAFFSTLTLLAHRSLIKLSLSFVTNTILIALRHVYININERFRNATKNAH